MGIKNKINEGYPYFLTFTVVDWVDVFSRPAYRHIILDSQEYCQKNKGLKIHAWCLMSNHLHLIVASDKNFNLSDTIRDFKKFTSKAITAAISELAESRKKWMLNRFEFAGKYNSKITNYKFWQDGNEAKEIHTTSFLQQKLDYIHNNPVVAEIVENPEDYLYSSTKNYCNEKGLIDIILIE